MSFRDGGGSAGGSGVTYAAPSGDVNIGDAAAEGASTDVPRADHQHAFPAPGGAPPAVAAASAAGGASTPARSDHAHQHTAAHHLTGGHADLSASFAAAGHGHPGGDVATHEAAGDPHPGYLTPAEHPTLVHTVAQPITVQKDSAGGGTRPKVNLHEGANITLTLADDPANGELDLTIAAAGGAAPSLVVLDKVLATATIANSAAEANLYSKVLTGGSLAAADVLRLTLVGDYLNNSGASSTLTLRVKLGATTALSTIAVGMAASANRRKWAAELFVFMETTSAQRFGGQLMIGSANNSTMDGLGTNHGPAYGTAAEATNVDKTLAVTAQHGTAAATIDVRLHAALLEKLS